VIAVIGEENVSSVGMIIRIMKEIGFEHIYVCVKGVVLSFRKWIDFDGLAIFT
jgi:hypothetical protein